MKTQGVMTLFIASDHAGFQLKENLKKAFPEVKWNDLGPVNEDRVDYPDFADKLAKEAGKTASLASSSTGAPSPILGVLICGSGQGMAIRANRYRELRAALCWNEEVAQLSRAHNDANVLCLGQRMTDLETAKKIFRTFTTTPFEGGRHQGRVDKLGLPPCDPEC